MIKPKSGYYFYSSLHNQLTFHKSHVHTNELPYNTILVSPAILHQIVLDINSTENCVAYFHEDNYLLHDLHFMLDIYGLTDI